MYMGIDKTNKISFIFLQNLRQTDRFSVVGVCGR